MFHIIYKFIFKKEGGSQWQIQVLKKEGEGL